MNCPRCGLDLPKGVNKFCPECGQKFDPPITVQGSAAAKAESVLNKPIPVRKLAGIGCLSFLVLFFIFALFSSGTTNNRPSVSSEPAIQIPQIPTETTQESQIAITPTPSPTMTPRKPFFTPRPTPIPQWQVVRTWQGNSSKKTEDFTVTSSQWRILWKSWPGEYGRGHFSIEVYGTNGVSGRELMVNRTEPGQDVSYFRIPGEFYLDISGDDHPWWIQVEELR